MRSLNTKIKDKIFISLFTLGWAVIAYSLFKLSGGNVISGLNTAKHLIIDSF